MDPRDGLVLRRFHRLLVRECGARWPWDLTAPLLVSDIVHNLVPFPARRAELRLETISDYEDVLRRLLRGEGGFLRLEAGAGEKVRDRLDSDEARSGLHPDLLAAYAYLCPDAPGMPLPGEKKGSLPPVRDCRWCGHAVPREARVRFCPYCGWDVRFAPCPLCGEGLRLDWRFCIGCGRNVGGLLGHHLP